MYHIDLSMGEHTNFGKTLFKVWYQNSALTEIINGVRGCPHTGGRHSLVLTNDSLPEIKAWLELFKETYPIATREIDLVCGQLSNDVKTINLHDLCGEREPYLNWSKSPYGFTYEGRLYDQQTLEKETFRIKRFQLLRGETMKGSVLEALLTALNHTPVEL